jgi:Uma2 family endonuclease
MGFGDMATQTTPQAASFTPVAPAPSEPIPPLENGDRLSCAEFERRYSAMPHVKKAELIEGIVYMPSPVRWRRHSKPHSRSNFFLESYAQSTPGVEAGLEATVRVDPDNEFQPDNFLLKSKGGQARISADDYVEGSPELVWEVSASSVSIDLHKKFEVYRRNGVKEYVVWRVEDREIDWFILGGDQYEPLQAGPDGIVRSEVFPGLWLDRAAMLADDIRRVLEVLKAGLDSAEHQAFVAQLKERAD